MVNKGAPWETLFGVALGLEYLGILGTLLVVDGGKFLRSYRNYESGRIWVSDTRQAFISSANFVDLVSWMLQNATLSAVVGPTRATFGWNQTRDYFGRGGQDSYLSQILGWGEEKSKFGRGGPDAPISWIFRTVLAMVGRIPALVKMRILSEIVLSLMSGFYGSR